MRTEHPTLSVSAQHGGVGALDRNLWVQKAVDAANKACYLQGISSIVTAKMVIGWVRYQQRQHGFDDVAFRNCCELEGVTKKPPESDCVALKQRLKEVRTNTMNTLRNIGKIAESITSENFQQMKSKILAKVNMAAGQYEHHIVKMPQDTEMTESAETSMSKTIISLFSAFQFAQRDALIRSLSRTHAELPSVAARDSMPAGLLHLCCSAYDCANTAAINSSDDQVTHEGNLILKFVQAMANEFDTVITKYPIWTENLHAACDMLSAKTPNGVRYSLSWKEFCMTLRFNMSNRVYELIQINMPGFPTYRLLQKISSQQRKEQGEAGSDKHGTATTVQHGTSNVYIVQQDKTEMNADGVSDAGEADCGGGIPSIFDKQQRHAMRQEREDAEKKIPTMSVEELRQFCKKMLSQLPQDALIIQ
jgi:hypothetical protein